MDHWSNGLLDQWIIGFSKIPIIQNSINPAIHRSNF